MRDFSQFIREVPDFPKPGIVYKDITPLIGNPVAFHRAIDAFTLHYLTNMKQLMLLSELKHEALFSVPHSLIGSAQLLSRSENMANYPMRHLKLPMILNTVLILWRFIKMHSANIEKS